MENTETQSAEVDVEAQALADATAGYNSKARAQAPAEPEVAAVQAAQPLADSAQTASASTPDPEEDEPDLTAEAVTPSAEAAIAQQLEDLKAQVREMKASGADAETVRKMHGDIGEINRTLKQLKALEKADAPADDELAAALKDAETVAGEYPELAGPLVKAIRVMQARMATPAAKEETTEVVAPAQTVDPQRLRLQVQQEEAIKALDEVHPDRHQVKESAEFKTWFATKPPEYQKKVTTSWNPAVVAQPFTDFKAYVAARKRKQDRLEAAATPQGLPRATPTTISDEEAARRGYERGRGKRL
jgi:hypothetical protein